MTDLQAFLYPATCSWCGEPVTDDAHDFGHPQDYHHLSKECRYVGCDDSTCRAARDPQTLEEWQAVARHYKSHAYLGGCAHGR